MTHSTLIAGSLAAALGASPAASAGLDAYFWKARPVVVFAPAAADARAADQLARLRAERAALDDREMPVFVVTGRQVTTLSGGRPPSALAAADLRRAYGVKDDAFAMILIGKDGGEKFRTAEPVPAGRLIGLVDDMPMRRREAR